VEQSTERVTEEILIGGDPEFFVTNGTGFISAKGLLGGSKEEPKKIKNGAVQEDNIMLEMNIIPSATVQEFNTNVAAILHEVSIMLHTKKLALVTSTGECKLDAKLQQLPEIFEFGCEPDFDAWTGDVNPAPDLANINMRFAGGHLHCSVNRALSYEEQRNLVQWFDLCVGTYCVLNDKNTTRATYYGTPGRFRPTKYSKNCMGVEYRVPSNFWMLNRHYYPKIFELAHYAMRMGLTNEFTTLSTGVHPKLVYTSIKERNKDLAQYIIRTHDILGRLVAGG